MRDVKTAAERGPIGAWAQSAREDADLSVEQALERLAAKGYAVTASTIRGVEGGSKKPGRRLVRELGAIYGSRAPGEPEAEPTDLVSAINELVVELRQSRIRQEQFDVNVLELLAAAVGRPDLAKSPSDSERSARAGTGR